MNETRAITIMVIVEIIVLFNLILIYSIIRGELLPIPTNPFLIVIPTVIFLGSFKHYLFYRKERWKTFLENFEKLSSKKKRIINILAITINVIVFLALYILLVKMDRIDWNN